MAIRVRKIIAAAFSAALCFSCLSGCQSKEQTRAAGSGIKIYVSLSQADTFRTTLVETAKQTAEANGAELVIYDAKNSIENQVEQMKQAVNENYDVIMCAPVDADTALELEALADDIPIIFYNSCPDASVLEEDKYMYVGSNEEVAGQYQAEYLLEAFSSQNSLDIVLLKGTKNHSATSGRTEGLKTTLAASGKQINYIFEDYADWEQFLSEKYFDIFLRTGSSIDAIVCQNDGMALGAIETCKKYHLTDIPILGIDATADGCAAIASGELAFTVYQSAKGQGEAAVQAALALGSGSSTKEIEGRSEDGCYIWVPFEKVDRSNVASYY